MFTVARKVSMNKRMISSVGSAIDADLLDRARKWDLAEKDHEEKTRLHQKRMGDSVHKLKEKRPPLGWNDDSIYHREDQYGHQGGPHQQCPSDNDNG